MGVVLLVSPEPVFRAELCRELELRGYETLAVSDWDEALDLGRRRAPSALVLDVGHFVGHDPAGARGLTTLRNEHEELVVIALGQATQPNPTQPNRDRR